ncbi:MAG: pitrilysin family protein [Kangiellaceae bacterium]|jgi:zinc protease|nr:pitrilysin family protein [Kangiellaceae bacterium]
MNKLIVAAALTSFLLVSCGDNKSSNIAGDDKQTTKPSQGSSNKLTPSTENKSIAELDYESYQLANGLTVVMHVDRSDPVVAVNLTAHVGSSRELPGRTGFAHLFEHLLFLESENLGKGGLDKMSARIGGSGANGSTSRDITNYFQTVPRNALEKMIWAEADKLGFFINTVTDPVLAKEKQVVKNEKRQSVDNRPYGHTQYVIDKNLYPDGHPYSWQVIGSLEDLQNATLKDVKDFFKRWYTPNNVTLVIAGDFDVEQAKTWVKKYFDEIPAGKSVEKVVPQPAKLDDSKRLVYQDNFARVPELTLTWPTVPRYHKDHYPLRTLQSLLSDGKDAMLNKVLIDDKKITSRVIAASYDSEIAGQMFIRVRAFNDVDLDNVHDTIFSALSMFEEQGFSEQQLSRIKAQQELSFYRRLSSVLGKSIQLANYSIYTDNPGFLADDIDQTLAVSEADIWRVYNRYIKNKSYIATSFVPKDKLNLALAKSTPADIVEEVIVAGAEAEVDGTVAATYQKTPSSFDRSIEPAYDEKPIQLAAPDVKKLTFTNGMSAFTIESNEVPLINFELAIKGGMLFDDEDKIGSADLMARLMNRGTAKKTPAQLEASIEGLGAQIRIASDKTSVMISGQTLSKNFDQTIALMTEMLLEPRWDHSEFELIKKQQINRLIDAKSQPRSIANREFEQLFYGESNRLAKQSVGDESTLKNIEIADLKSYYANYLSPNNSQLHIVGNVTQQQIQSAFQPLAKKWSSKKVELPKVIASSDKNLGKLFFYDVPNAKQSVLVIGRPGPKATDENFFASQVMNYRLGGGGFASLLTQQLRESKGYTYGIRSSFTGDQYSGRFSISTGVRANVTYESLDLIKSIMQNYANDLTQSDVELTRGYFIKSNARRFETPQAKLTILNDISQYSLPADYAVQRLKVLDGLTLTSMK